MSRAAAGGLGFRAAKSPHQKKRDILSDVSFLLWLPTGFVVCTPRIPQGRECEYKETAGPVKIYAQNCLQAPAE